MILLPNEEKLLSSNNDKVVLTDLRVRMTDYALGKTYTIIIFLEDISSIEVRYKSQIILLILAGISVFGGFFMNSGYHEDSSVMWGFVLGAMFFIAWLLTRRHIISIASDGGAVINFIVEGMSEDKVSDFVDRLSLAKHERINKLFKQ